MSKTFVRRSPPRGPTDLFRAVEETLQVHDEMERLLAEIRAALLEGNDQAALALVRHLADLPPVKVK